MESLVNYSSEDEQDDHQYTKVGVRERGSGRATSFGRSANETSGSLKLSYEPSKGGSCNDEASYRKSRGSGNERFKSGSTNYNEDKYKSSRRSDNSRDQRDKKDNRDLRNNRDFKDDDKDHDHTHKYDYKKLDDQKRYRESKREYRRDDHRDDKRYNRYDERKTGHNANKDRLSTSKSRYDNRKQYDDRFNDERRAANEERRGGFTSPNIDDRRKEFTDRRNHDNDDRKNDRRSDDRRTQRSYTEDRLNAYRPRRSKSPLTSHHSKTGNYNERKEESNSRRDRKRHSRSRSRSRSRSHSADHSVAPNLESTRGLHHRIVPGEHLSQIKHPEADSHISEKKLLPTARNFEGLLSLPLSENAPKHPSVATVPATSVAAGSNTAAGAVQLPSYYNPNVINPNKYVEQMQKRKLIWGAKKVEDSASKWGHAQFSQDQDGKVASKFMRLMGIKNATGTGSDINTSPNEIEMKSPSSNTSSNNVDVKSREAMFSTMEHQYEVARQVTHTMRGVGLGFSSQARPF